KFQDSPVSSDVEVRGHLSVFHEDFVETARSGRVRVLFLPIYSKISDVGIQTVLVTRMFRELTAVMIGNIAHLESLSVRIHHSKVGRREGEAANQGIGRESTIAKTENFQESGAFFRKRVGIHEGPIGVKTNGMGSIDEVLIVRHGAKFG